MKKLALVSSVLSILSAPAFANSSNDTNSVIWNTASASYVSTSIDDSDGLDPTGFNFALRRMFNENVFLYAEYDTVGADTNFTIFGNTVKTELDMSGLSFGGGFKHAISDNTDAFVSAGLSTFDMEVTASVPGYGSESETLDGSGTNFRAGVASRINEKIQVLGSLYSTSTEIEGESDTSSGFQLTGMYIVQADFGVHFTYTSGDGSSTTSFGASYYF